MVGNCSRTSTYVSQLSDDQDLRVCTGCHGVMKPERDNAAVLYLLKLISRVLNAPFGVLVAPFRVKNWECKPKET